MSVDVERCETVQYSIETVHFRKHKLARNGREEIKCEVGREGESTLEIAPAAFENILRIRVKS